MGSKHVLAKTKRKWEQQVGPALTANAFLMRYRASITNRKTELNVSQHDLIGESIDAWAKQGKATYLVDPDLSEELVATPLPDGETPHEVFLRRPHNIGYFVFPKPQIHAMTPELDQPPTLMVFDGILVHEHQATDARKNVLPSIWMTAVGHEQETGRTMSITFTVPLGEFWELLPLESEEHWKKLSNATTVNLQKLHLHDRDYCFDEQTIMHEWKSASDLFFLAVNLMLYISAADPDLEEIPEPVVGGRRVGPAHAPNVHYLGYRVGAVLRNARAASTASDPTGRAVTPHLRRAHWHRYWTGPRTGDRKLVLRWVSQTLVAADAGKFTPAVRPVLKSA
jgi:hypothetical protein